MEAGAMKSTETVEAVAGAYYVLHLLPVEPIEAEAGLAAIEHALAHPAARRDSWTGPMGVAFAHLRKRTPETAAAMIAVTREIIEAVRPRFA
jgi:hypothetical protein